MREFLRRIVLIVCALTFMGSSVIGLALSSAEAAESCVHQQTASHVLNQAPPGDHDAVGCLVCCQGACLDVVGLPPRVLAGSVPLAATPIIYWATEPTLAGRSITPEPIPPRGNI